MTEPNKVMLVPETWEHTPDSSLITANCGHRAWISQNALNLTLDPSQSLETLCLDCVPSAMLRAMQTEEIEVRAVPGAKEELIALYGKERVEAVFRKNNIKEF